MVDFAKENPQVAVYVRFRPGRAPRLIGEYCKSNVIATILYTLYMCIYILQLITIANAHTCAYVGLVMFCDFLYMTMFMSTLVTHSVHVILAYA